MCDYMQTVMHLGEAATVNDGELIADLFGAVGKVWKMDEKLSDAAGAVGGAGTAFAYIAIEAMADGGVVAGLPREICLSLASQAVSGICTDYFFRDCLCWVLDVCF
ncbi:hypothetical protein PS1_009187 [Malus domestica]